mgnify:FL=1
MKLNIVLIIAVSILIYFLMLSSENKDDISVIQKIGNMIQQYEHNQRLNEQERAFQELLKKFDCTINNNQLVHENAGIIECPKE